MSIHPIIERELRAALYKKGSVRQRQIYGWAVGGFTFLFIALCAMAGSRNIGKNLFPLLFVAGLFLATVPTLVLTADVLSQERRNKTLGLLFLSGLTPTGVFASKFLSSLLIVFCNIVAILPMLALPFLFGGIPVERFLAAIFALPCIQLFVMSLALLGSALHEDEGTAIMTAAAIGVPLCATTPLLFAADKVFAGGSIPNAFLLLSPAYGPSLVLQSVPAGTLGAFWTNSLVTLGYSVLLLIAAGWVLRRNWQKMEAGEVANRTTWRQHVDLLLIGKRAREADQLDLNPILGLMSCQRRPVFLAWISVGATLGLCAIFSMLWGTNWIRPANLLLLTLLLNISVVILAVYAAARVAAEDRRSGRMELLLTTPLSKDQILDGLEQGTRLLFDRLFKVLVGLNLVALIAGLVTRTWSWYSLMVYLQACGIIFVVPLAFYLGCFWDALWISLNSGRPVYSVVKPFQSLFTITAQIIIGRQAFGNWLLAFPYGNEAEFVVTTIFFFACLLFLRFARPVGKIQKLKKELRSIAREPVPQPGDPRFKKWDISKRFPSSNQEA